MAAIATTPKLDTSRDDRALAQLLILLTNVLSANTTTNADTVTFSQQLTPGQEYFLVTTGRQVSDFGVFTNTISRLGQTQPVPESDSLPAMLMAVGVGFLLYKGIRRDLCQK